jgi:RNA polymerase sigma-70 factor (ECF subfamily)
MGLSADEFGRLALEQLDTLSRVAASLARNRAEADDLVQETYLRALRAREQFQQREHGLRPWLLRIMHNTHLTRVGRSRRQPVATDPAQLEAQGEAGARFPAVGPEHEDTVRRALAELPPELGSSLVLWAVEELTYKEIADVLEIPIGTVMSRLHRARRVLAAKLRERSPEVLKGAGERYG